MSDPNDLKPNPLLSAYARVCAELVRVSDELERVRAERDELRALLVGAEIAMGYVGSLAEVYRIVRQRRAWYDPVIGLTADTGDVGASEWIVTETDVWIDVEDPS